MSARGLMRERVAVIMYDDLEPCQIMDGVLLSVYADQDSQWICLNFSSGGLLLRAQAADDTIVFRDGIRGFDGIDVSASATWKDLIGKEFGWGWLSMNQKGYFDTALIGTGPIPEVAVTVIASSMRVSRIGEWRRACEQ